MSTNLYKDMVKVIIIVIELETELEYMMGYLLANLYVRSDNCGFSITVEIPMERISLIAVCILS